MHYESDLKTAAHYDQDASTVIALDIGTSKVVVLIAECYENAPPKIIGIGTHPSRGLKKGVVVNIESTVRSIEHAINEAQQVSEYEINSVCIGMSGAHIRSQNSDGMVAIRDKVVSRADLSMVLEAAKAVVIPAEQRMLQTSIQDYVLDGQGGIRDPLGMAGVRLDAKVHLVTCSDNVYKNLEKCVTSCGIKVDNAYLNQLASASAVLTEDEKNLGVCLVDIGSGTMDIAIYTDGTIRHTHVIPVGGDYITNDIAMVFSTPTQYAEEIKIRYACALANLTNPEQTVKVPSVGDREPRLVLRQNLAGVVESRYVEMLGMVLDELRRSGYEDLIPAGIVLTGGTAKMEGTVELAEEIFHKQVRVGVPLGVTGMVDVVKNPAYSTAVGLILQTLNDEDEQSLLNDAGEQTELEEPGWLQKLKDFVNRHF